MSDSAMAPGWYHGEGDPAGTQRYWDGNAWVGEPQMIESAGGAVQDAAGAMGSAASGAMGSVGGAMGSVGGAAMGAMGAAGAAVGGMAAATANNGPLDWWKMPWTRYAEFSGRSRRAEYWWFTLGNVIVAIVLSVVFSLISSNLGSIVNLLFSLAIFIPSLAVAIRRLHDTGRSGWWLLIGLIPLIGFIVLLVFYFTDSDPAPNKYGASPKYS